MSLTLRALENWDGKSTDDLQEIYNKLNSQSLASEFLAMLPYKRNTGNQHLIYCKFLYLMWTT